MSETKPDGWIRSKIWSETIESDFLLQLDNTPRTWAMERLKDQGNYWLWDHEEVIQQAGIRLLEILRIVTPAGGARERIVGAGC